MTTNTEQLKPCPFCGSEYVKLVQLDERSFVMCNGCGADMDSINCYGDPIAAWNRRKTGEHHGN